MKRRLTFEQVQQRDDARRAVIGLRELGHEVPRYAVLAKWHREESLRWLLARRETPPPSPGPRGGRAAPSPVRWSASGERRRMSGSEADGCDL